MLIKLFYDYVDDPSFREEFQKDPAPFLRKLGVSPSDLDLLRTRNQEGLRARLHQEIDQLLSEALDLASRYSFLYPIGTTASTSINPTQGSTNTSISFTIYGSWLVNVAKVVFINGNEYQATDLQITNQSDFGSELTGTVELPASGHYKVHLEPAPGSGGNPCHVPGGFTAV